MKKRLLPFAIFFLITFSVNAQEVWEAQAEGVLPSSYSVLDISVVNEQVAWAIALDFNQWVFPIPSTHLLKVMRTTDGGANWSVKDFTDAPGRMSLGIYALDENTAMLNTTNFQNERGLYRTTNGGENWIEVLSGAVSAGRTLFFDDNDGVCMRPGHGIAISNNGGETWSLLMEGTDYPTFLSGEGQLNSPTIWNIIDDTLWFGTTEGRVYKSTDRGENWTVHQATANTSNSFISIAFIDHDQGLALVGDFNNPPLLLLQTSDGGEVWDELSNNLNLSEIHAIPSTNSIIGVSFFDSLTVWSSDFGVSWETLDTDLPLWGPVFSAPETGWIASGEETGLHPAIYKWIGPALTPVTETAIGSIELSPNPATDFIHLTFPVATEKPIEVKLYTTTGRLMLTAKISDGEAIPVDQMIPGLYFVELLFNNKSYSTFFIKQ